MIETIILLSLVLFALVILAVVLTVSIIECYWALTEPDTTTTWPTVAAFTVLFCVLYVSHLALSLLAIITVN